jgi:hypothetical protein
MHRPAGGDEHSELRRVPQLACRFALDPVDGFGQLHDIEEARRTPLDPLADLALEPLPTLFVRATLADPPPKFRPPGDEGLMRKIHERLAAGLFALWTPVDCNQVMLDQMLQHV